jgi:hypothetical protein
MNTEFNPQNFQIISVFVIGIITGGIIPLVRAISKAWKANAPIRAKRKADRIKKRELNKINK